MDTPDLSGLGLEVHTKVNGVKIMGHYTIEAGAVQLTSADFGEASSSLNGVAAHDVAERLLQDLAKAAMAGSEASYLTEEEIRTSS